MLEIRYIHWPNPSLVTRVYMDVKLAYPGSQVHEYQWKELKKYHIQVCVALELLVFVDILFFDKRHNLEQRTQCLRTCLAKNIDHELTSMSSDYRSVVHDHL